MNAQYKGDFEKASKLYAEAAVRVIHLAVKKFTIIQQDKGVRLNKLMESLYSLLVDSIVSGLSFEFVDKLKSLLNYEISLIKNLEIK